VLPAFKNETGSHRDGPRTLSLPRLHVGKFHLWRAFFCNQHATPGFDMGFGFVGWDSFRLFLQIQEKSHTSLNLTGRQCGSESTDQEDQRQGQTMKSDIAEPGGARGVAM